MCFEYKNSFELSFIFENFNYLLECIAAIGSQAFRRTLNRSPVKRKKKHSKFRIEYAMPHPSILTAIHTTRPIITTDTIQITIHSRNTATTSF